MIRICGCSANLRHLALKYGVLGRRSLGGLLMGLLLFSVTLLSAGSLFATGSHFDENPVATAKWEVREVKGEEGRKEGEGKDDEEGDDHNQRQ